VPSETLSARCNALEAGGERGLGGAAGVGDFGDVVCAMQCFIGWWRERAGGAAGVGDFGDVVFAMQCFIGSGRERPGGAAGGGDSGDEAYEFQVPRPSLGVINWKLQDGRHRIKRKRKKKKELWVLRGLWLRLRNGGGGLMSRAIRAQRATDNGTVCPFALYIFTGRLAAIRERQRPSPHSQK